MTEQKNTSPLRWKKPCKGCIHLLDTFKHQISYDHYVKCGVDIKDTVPEAFRNMVEFHVSGAGVMTRKSVYGPFVENPREYTCRYFNSGKN